MGSVRDNVSDCRMVQEQQKLRGFSRLVRLGNLAAMPSLRQPVVQRKTPDPMILCTAASLNLTGHKNEKAGSGRRGNRQREGG